MASDCAAVPGLELTSGLLSEADQQSILTEIARIKFLRPTWVEKAPEGRSALQLGDYAFVYDGTRGIRPMPEPRPLLSFLSKDYQWMNNVIVNDYDGKDAHIKPHVDSAWFGERIEIFSFGSACTMTFRPTDSSSPKRADVRLRLLPGDRLTLTGDARNNFTHEIKANDIDGPRVSVTGRSVDTTRYLEKASSDLMAVMPGVFSTRGDAADMAKCLKSPVA